MSVAGRARKRRILVPGSARSAGGIVLPGPAPARAATLHVPRGYASEEVVLVGHCEICDATFYRGQEDDWQKHVGWCARRNLDAIREVIAERKERMAVFQPEAWDPEIRAHMDKVAERMKREGRLTVRPNERAGFS